MPSKRVDDAGIYHWVEIDHWDKDQRVGMLFLDSEIQLAVYLHDHRLSTTSAFCMDGHRQGVSLKLPLHEGRRYRVNPSSCKGLFTAIESNPVGCAVDRYRISPGNTFGATAIQKCHAFL